MVKLCQVGGNDDDLCTGDRRLARQLVLEARTRGANAARTFRLYVDAHETLRAKPSDVA